MVVRKAGSQQLCPKDWIPSSERTQHLGTQPNANFTLKEKRLIPLGFEPRTFRVLGGCDNHYTTESALKAVGKPSKWISFNPIARVKTHTFLQNIIYMPPRTGSRLSAVSVLNFDHAHMTLVKLAYSFQLDFPKPSGMTLIYWHICIHYSDPIASSMVQ